MSSPSRPPYWWVHPCLSVDPASLRLVWLILAWRDVIVSASKPSHGSLASCALLLVWETQLQVHFWLVDKLSRLQPCLELCWFTQALLKPGLARQKVPFSYGVARGPNYNILSEQMVYYSRYATGKKCVMLGSSLLQLVTYEPEANDITEAHLKQSLPWSSHVLTTWQSIVSMYPAPTRHDLPAVTMMIHLGVFRENSSLVPPHLRCWHWSSYTHLSSLGQLSSNIASLALKLISALKFPPTEDVPLSTLWAGHHIYFCGLSVEG
jgi:hypothetical protein